MSETPSQTKAGCGDMSLSSQLRGRSAQAKKKFTRPHLHGQKLSVVVYTCHLSYSRKCRKGSWSRPTWAKVRLISKIITRAKRGGGMAQVVGCLLNKSETLSSNASTQKKLYFIPEMIVLCYHYQCVDNIMHNIP
jgi:hypothetical protein